MDVLLLRASGMTKRFGGVPALDHVDFEVRSGEVHALVGENGAGKSTLIKTLTGVYPPDQGAVHWEGRPVVVDSPQRAYQLGIAVIHQERQLVPQFTAVENLFLGHRYPRRLGGLSVDWAAMRRKAQEVMTDLGVEVPLDLPVSRLAPAARTIVELMRANLLDCRLLFLDEPTAALTDHEIRALFGLIRRLQARGTAFVYVSHRLEEVMEMAGRITVLRNGRYVATVPGQGIDRRQLVELISGEAASGLATGAGENATHPPLGAELRPGDGIRVAPAASATPATTKAATGPLLSVEELATADGRVQGASLTLYPGEILGIFGLAGAGRTELLEAIYGDRPIQGGSLGLWGRSVRFRSPTEALAAGVVLIPEDRRGHGLVMNMTIRENVTLPVLGRHRWGPGVILRRQEVAEVVGLMQDLGVKATGPEQTVATLSGGNQQKVVMAKALIRQPQVFLCDEPTQAVDVVTRREIHQLLRQMAAAGVGVLFVSSDLPEVLEVSDRMLVMRAGRTVAELDPAGVDSGTVLRICYGEEEAAS